MDLAEEVYRVTESFPSHERYGLSIQMRRAAIPIPSNIAEGVCRSYTREYRRFVTIALGSLAELETQLEMARRLGYLNAEESKEAGEMATVLGKRLQTLRQALHKKINPPTSH